MNPQHHITNRACRECKRKKTRCNGAKPYCALCIRTHSTCIYPQRKPRTQVQAHSRSVSEAARPEDSDSTRGATLLPQELLTSGQSQSGTTPPSHDYDVLSNTVPPVASSQTLHSFSTAKWPTRTSENPFSWPMSSIYTAPGLNAHEAMIAYPEDMIPGLWTAETEHIFDYAAVPVFLHEPPYLVPSNSGNDYANTSYPSPGHTRSGQNMSPSSEALPPSHRIDLPPVAIDELIDLFFQRIHGFLPIFHKPNFYATYVRKDDETRYSNLSNAAALVINGMIALAARYSTSPIFEGVAVKDRGQPYSYRAQELCDNEIRRGPFKASLLWVQGVILTSYYNQSGKPGLGCDLTVAALARWAYELTLHRIDEDQLGASICSISNRTVQQWVAIEEQRRAWWAIWELDAYDSISSRRPFLLARDRNYVLLPVSDEAWFAGEPVASDFLSPSLMQCWKALRDSPNQSERAWFLVSNHITTHALELCQQRQVTSKTIEDVQAAVSCFALLFHEVAQKKSDLFTYDDKSNMNRNWITLTQLMIQTARIATGIMIGQASSNPPLNPSNRFAKRAYEKRPPDSVKSVPDMKICRQAASEVFRTYQSWSPELVACCPPLIVSIIVGPDAVILRYALHLRGEQNEGNRSQPSMQEDLLILILGNVARYWNIGSFLLDFATRIQKEVEKDGDRDGVS